jgi:hypothetical protein
MIWTLLLVAVCLGLAILGVYWWTGYRESVTDRSLFTGSPCAPPCWQGIIPGETTAEEALQILQSSPYVKRKGIEKTGSYALGAIGAYWKAGSGGVSVRLRDGLAYQIALGIPYRLTLGEVIEEFGMAEALMVNSAGVPENRWWMIHVYYPARGMEFIVDEQFEGPSLEPSTQVKAVTLVVPRSSLEGLLAELYETYREDYLEHTRRWKGYGRIFEIYYDSLEDVIW